MHKVMILAALAAGTASADVRIDFGEQMDTVDGVTADTHLSSGDHILVGDTRYMVLSDADWTWLTNKINSIQGKFKMLHDYYKGMNEHEEGRVAVHGRRGHTTITNGTEQIAYADGYVHVRPLASQKVKRHEQIKPKKSVKTERVISSFEKRRAEILAKRRNAMSKTNEVSVTVGGGK